MKGELIYLDDVKLNGIGPKNLEKLKNAGITTLQALAILTPVELVSYTGMGIETAGKAIQQARNIISPAFIPAKEYEEHHTSTRLTTGAPELDRILGGGLRGGAITELIGEFGSGKTQIALTAMVEHAGNGGVVLDIDTEGTHLPQRLRQIAEHRGHNPDEVLSNILFARAYNSEHLIAIVNQLPRTVGETDAGLVVVDSIISHFRGEYTGLNTLSERQQRLAQVVHMLTRVAEGFRIPVLVTNQVTTQIGVLFGDPNRGAGGNIMGHGGTYRVFLRKGKMDGSTGWRTVIASVIDSAELMEEKVRLLLTVGGVRDAGWKQGDSA